jgi:hypothetical protein
MQGPDIQKIPYEKHLQSNAISALLKRINSTKPESVNSKPTAGSERRFMAAVHKFTITPIRVLRTW